MAAVLAVVAALLLGPVTTAARADGDPASDVLIAGRVFVGFGDSTTTPAVRELLELTAESRRMGFPIRVAVIREATDLGSVPSLFGQAERYATFLGQELRFVYHGTLVVVMGGKPGGIGVFGRGATVAAKAAVRGIAVPVAGDAGELAKIASTAIRRVAAASGHVLTTPRATVGEKRYALTFGIVGALAVVALLVAVLVIFRRRRQMREAFL
jgi:hypothetical protein